MRLLRCTALFATAALALPGCGSGSGPESGAGSARKSVYDRDRGEEVTIVGTTLRASSGEPLSGVQVTGPGGVRAISDGNGRFHLRGLEVGSAGALVARSEEGLVAENQLRELRGGTLEVVLRLRQP